MQFLFRFARDSHTTVFDRMPELAMAAFASHLNPAVTGQGFQEITNGDWHGPASPRFSAHSERDRSHFICPSTANTRTGPPVPCSILIGATMT